MTSRHILVVNRWADGFADYGSYIDHARDRVTYVTTPDAVGVLDRHAAEVRPVASLADHEEVLGVVRGLAARHGRPAAVVALSEFDLELAALIREELEVAGHRPVDVRAFRDKVVMKELAAAGGVRVPRFTTAEGPATVRLFVERVGLPVVLKPRRGASSEGVRVITTSAQLEEALQDSAPDGECEEYVAGTMYHVDGFVQQGRVAAMKVGRYVNTCLDFTFGLPLGTAGVDDPVLTARMAVFTQRAVEALGLDGAAFHLEIIQDAARAEAEDDLVFLEIGARVSGGELPFLWRDVYGLDLIGAHVALQIGETVTPPGFAPTDEIGGALLIPEPRPLPCRVVEATSHVGRIPGLYEEVVPAVGTVFDGHGGYEHVGGRFRFRGPTSDVVERAIEQVIADYRLVCEPCEARVPGAA